MFIEIEFDGTVQGLREALEAAEDKHDAAAFWVEQSVTERTMLSTLVIEDDRVYIDT